MRWTKHGLLFRPHGRAPWMQTHAAAPLVHPLGDDRQRVYFASRDGDNRSHVAWVEVNLADPTVPPKVAEAPALAPGPLGHFDDHGVYPGSIVEHDGRLLLYYMGWNPGPRSPLFTASIGLAASDDGGLTFERLSPAPIMARSVHDPCLVTSPCVLREGDLWRMWYVSGIRWEEVSGELHSYYHIKYAESADGIAWARRGQVCIDLLPGERNIARPNVLRCDGGYEMWYSHSGGMGYRPGYARSHDGIDWTRLDDHAGIELSPHGWDSEAIAYPWVVRLGGRRHMVYNGNDYGREGFGLATECGPSLVAESD
jgi:hypothetical protein